MHSSTHTNETNKELETPLPSLPARIVLLGTSHVSAQSARDVHAAIPHADLIAIELDRGRAEGLLSGKRATFSQLQKHLGFRTALLATVLRWLQERIASSLDVTPGLEMKTALEASAHAGKRVALIDREIAVTMHRLRAAFGMREFAQLFRDAFKRRAIAIHPSDDVVMELLKEMRDRYPRLYAVMVSERDTYMATALVRLALAHPEKTILAVVGKGHVPGMTEQIRYLNSAISVESWSSPVKSA